MADGVDFSMLQKRFTSPLQLAIGGAQAGQQFRAVEEKRQAGIDAVETQRQQARQLQLDLGALADNPNPTAKDFSSLTLKHPQLAKEFKQSFDTLSEERKKTTQSQAINIFSALSAGKNDIAKQMLEEIKTGAASAGLEEQEKSAEALLGILEVSPEAAKTTAALHLASTMGPSAFNSIFKQVVAPKGAAGVTKVQSSEILPDGTVQIVTDIGTTEIISPSEAGKRLVKEAREFGAEIQGLRAGERDSAKNAQKISIDFFKQLEPISTNIANLNEGIRLIDEGAETGPIAKFFPSIREASVKLDNLQGKLGLDVLRTTTFGALSEKELAFALDTALPTKLEGPALKDWLRRKRDAQQKLMNFYSEAAIHLGIPGNSISEFLDKKKAAQGAAPEEDPAAPTQVSETQQLDADTARQLLQEAGGDKAKARQLATERGFTF
jgi:hypothetical protein